MVLIQLLLPTTGGAGGDSLAPLAETRRELAERFNGLTAYLAESRSAPTSVRTRDAWWAGTRPSGHGIVRVMGRASSRPAT